MSTASLIRAICVTSARTACLREGVQADEFFAASFAIWNDKANCSEARRLSRLHKVVARDVAGGSCPKKNAHQS
ncbi:MAG: hypothetical protein ING73_03175 [Rhodocyclaceae bacterium]|nr:hypothetical protein [Rhodocyclaceae bacterium]MCA3024395.1 hypothetical protein [Rhodocyclaceae bacterium]MCA3032546.1 hypothetical protein [Rhodocyclaceae bacterium]MCA3037475.1 hypothetical protein [Rhodocyclaceae bacterium]MCA3039986.1 hypothetical protein [Rhodocyclaceae bacterium]